MANKTVLRGPVARDQAWVYGDAYPASGGGASVSRDLGRTYPVSRPAALTGADGSYITIPPPTYQEYSKAQVVNVKAVCKYPVAGDGVTDE